MIRLFPVRRLRRLLLLVYAQELRRWKRRNPNFDDNRYSDAYQIDLGFQSAPYGGPPIAPGDTAIIRVPILKPFRIIELRIPSNICCDFEILSLLVCNIEYVPGGPISCSIYSEVSDCCLELPLFQGGSEIHLKVRNIGPLPLRFRGAFRGERLLTPCSGLDRKGRPHAWKRRFLEETKALVTRLARRRPRTQAVSEVERKSVIEFILGGPCVRVSPHKSY
jgi:hypothetical protein